MKFIIGSQVQELTSAQGNKYKKFNVKKEDGVVLNNVVAFARFSQYNGIVGGATIEAILKEKEYNGQTSYTIDDEMKSQGYGGAKASEAKAKNVEKAQERKEEGIMISSTARMATDTVIAIMGHDLLESQDFKDSWREWRKWYVEQWDNVEDTNNDLPF